MWKSQSRVDLTTNWKSVFIILMLRPMWANSTQMQCGMKQRKIQANKRGTMQSGFTILRERIQRNSLSMFSYHKSRSDRANISNHLIAFALRRNALCRVPRVFTHADHFCCMQLIDIFESHRAVPRWNRSRRTPCYCFSRSIGTLEWKHSI